MNETCRKLVFSQVEVTDSVLPAEGSLSKLIKSMCLTDHFSKTKIKWEKIQLILSVI